MKLSKTQAEVLRLLDREGAVLTNRSRERWWVTYENEDTGEFKQFRYSTGTALQKLRYVQSDLIGEGVWSVRITEAGRAALKEQEQQKGESNG